jgi:hypothetical protein
LLPFDCRTGTGKRTKTFLCQRPAGQNFSRSCGKRKSTEKFCKGGAMSALTAGREPLSRAKPLNLDVTAEGLPLEQPPVLP